MTQEGLHQQLIQTCKNGTTDDVNQCLDLGADPNFNIKRPLNALHTAIIKDDVAMVKLLLEHGAIVKEFVLQQAIQHNKNYLEILLPNFADCEDISLLMGTLQAAINIDDIDLARQAISQGAKPEALVVYAIRNINSIKMLQLLLENGLNIHTEKNMILSEWMGSSAMHGGENWKSAKDDLIAFLFEYYKENLNAIEKFKSLRVPDKKHLFLMGLHTNNFTIMKFALMIGADKSEALNSAHRQYSAYKKGDIGSIYSTIYTSNSSGKLDYEIIEYILNSDIKFSKTTISRAVCFKHDDILNALNTMHDLEYGYEMAYEYQDEDLCNYFTTKGVTKETQELIKMKVCAIKGELKELRKVVSEGADVKALDLDTIIETINQNQLEVIKYLEGSGVLLDATLNRYLNQAMSQYKAYETVAYLVEQGLDITHIKKIPPEFKKRYPALADMWQRRFRNIFDYTIYLVKEVHPNMEGKEKEELLNRIAQLSSLPYVIKHSQRENS
ncbi:MAG: ankyrin repeat domain-containing protein [Campylobacterota bacterium]|nr:ankyrin repeat domain-containing protein [Campylobacterota bacterium]